MIESVRKHALKRDRLRAAEAALLRWYPGTSLAMIQRVSSHSSYPLIHGGRPRGVALNDFDPMPGGPAPRAA